MKKFSFASMSFILATMFAVTGCGGGGEDQPSGVVEKDKYEITVACQSEDSEKEVLEALKKAYEAKYPDRKINISTFTGKDFETYMLGLAQKLDGSPNIIWTSDSYHGRWDEYFTDLRPFYEASAETDYSLYYESMLDTAATNGYFKPTKNYTGSFRSNDKDTADGHEHYEDHSDYGLYYAPRDYNKPTLLCNTALFKQLDTQYETYVTELSGALPANYQSATARLNDIVAGNDWDDLDDLFAFAKMIAERIDFIVKTAEDKGVEGVKVQSVWKTKTALDLKLSWEPSYVTFLTAIGATNVINSDGTLNLTANSAALEELHAKLYPEGADRLCYAGADDTNFAQGYTFMKIVSRPVVLGFSNTFKQTYGEASLQAIQIPVEAIAAGNSGYAINNYYHDSKISVNGVEKSYDDICWDFIKFIITEEGQEVAGATGNNIPVLKSLYSAETNNGKTPAWRSVVGLEEMNQDAWVAGAELKQDWFNIYKAAARTGFRTQFQSFFANFQKSNYNNGSLADLISNVSNGYNVLKPTQNLLK